MHLPYERLNRSEVFGFHGSGCLGVVEKGAK